MRTSWRDLVSGILVATGAVVVYAKLQEYSWWLLGSWKSALAVLTVLAAGVFLLNISELFKFDDVTTFAETVLWLTALTVAVASLFSTTTQAEFVSSAILFGLAWGAQFARHIWVSAHSSDSHYMAAR